jgi:hypothetical protein
MQARIDEVAAARNEWRRFEHKDESPAQIDAGNRMVHAEKALRKQAPRSLAELAAKVCAIIGDLEGDREYTFSADDANWLAADTWVSPTVGWKSTIKRRRRSPSYSSGGKL